MSCLGVRLIFVFFTFIICLLNVINTQVMSYNSNGPVHIYNEGAYIRVTNDNNGVVINYVKAALVIQRDSPNTFFLKNDTFINYYNYTDIATPASTDIDDLLSTIKSWNTSMSSNINVTSTTTFSTSMMDPLSRLRVSSQPDTVLTLNTTYNKNPLRIDEITSSNALSSHETSKGVVNMNVVATTSSRIVRQSKIYTPHVYGSTTTAIINGILTTNNTNSNIVSKIGVFDDANDVTGGSAQSTGNGLFFRYDNKSNLNLVHRTNVSGSQVDTVVPQASWNMDTLDGNGPSGITLNVSGNNNFVFEWNQANTSSTARAGVYKSGVTFCHAFSNLSVFGNPALPVRWELAHDSNLGSANSATMLQGPAVIYSDEPYSGPNKTFAYDLGSNFKLLNTVSTVPLWSIRLADAYERAKIYPKELEILNISAGGVGKWDLTLNPTLTSASFSNVSISSFAEADSNATEASGGICVASGYIYSAGVTKIPLNDKDISVLCSISGTQDILTLQVTNINGTLNVSSSIEWIEQD